MQTGQLSSLRLTDFLKRDNRIRGFVLPAGVVCTFLAMVIVGDGMRNDNLWLDPMNMIARAMQVDFLDLRTYTMRPMLGHPPLFFLLLRAWIGVLGTSLVAMHLFPVFATVVAAAFVYRIARDFTGDTFAGFAAVLVLASLGVVQDYALEVHNYSLFLMLAAAVLFFFERWWAHPQSRVYSAGIVLTTLTLLYTHYYSIYLILALNAYALLLTLRNRRDGLRWLTLMGIVAVLYIPQIADILNGIDYGLSSGGTRRSDVETLRSTVWENAGAVIDGLLDSHTLIFLGIVVCAGLLLLYKRRTPGGHRFAHNALIILFCVAVSFGFALVANIVVPSLSVRRVMYLSAGISIITGCALSFWPRYVRWAALAALLLIMEMPRGSGIARWKWSEWNFHEMMTRISYEYEPGDLIYVQIDNRVMIYSFVFYTRLTLPSDVTLLVPVTANRRSAPPRFFGVGRYTRENEHNRAYFANEVFGKYVWNRGRFWVIHSTDELYGDTDTSWVGKIEGRDFKEVRTLQEGWLAATLFTADEIGKPAAPAPASLPEKNAMPVLFGDAIELLDFQVDRVSAAPGEEIDIRLDWLAKELPEQDYAIYVHLLGEDGTLSSQVDGAATHAGHTLPTLFWALDVPVYDQKVLTISPDTAPGHYVLKVGLYDRKTQARLPVTLPDGRVTDGLELARIEVK
jgi:hypothetical protein